MTGRETAVAWALLELNWLPLGAMCAALIATVSVTRFSIEPVGMASCLAVIAVYAGLAYYNAKAPHRGDPQVVFVLGSTAQLALVIVLMGPLTYVAAGANFPMQDASLHALDLALGLDWRAYMAYVNDHPLLAAWLSAGYAMIKWPILAIPVVLAMTGRYRRLQEFTLAFSLALIITTVVSAMVPAIGVFQQLGLIAADYPNLHPRAYLDQVRDLPLVRDGTMRHLDLFELTGIVTFPSFHAASAALYAWAFWPVRWARPVGIAANVLMLAGTPIDGGHYFVDLIGGIAVTALAIAAARLASSTLRRAGEPHSAGTAAAATDRERVAPAA
ncbi:MAG: phosphatase PAP2 family protein [Acetobacteraceae bacterium]|nr:phosphatase PAP2 family protein [Acetobacteraceae bacterium]